MRSIPLLTDPRGAEKPPGWFGRVAMPFLADERDLPFARLLLLSALLLVPSATALFVPGVFRWGWGAAYLAVNFGLFLGPFTLLLHNVSHRPFFAPRYRWLKNIIPWLWGPLFGQMPETYAAHHLGMHHVEENMQGDKSSTLAYQRDSAIDFLRYWGRFTLFGMVDLGTYLWRRGRKRVLRRVLVSEVLYFATLGALLYANWRAALVVFVIPLFTIRLLMMSGNWGQHAFIDAGDPANPYRNSITCINSGYNRRCFNDGYHIGHHVKMTRHWTQMPEDFEQNVATYAREGAIVFRGIDFFGVWVCLMLKRHDWLASRYVDLGDTAKGRDEVLALLAERLRPIYASPAGGSVGSVGSVSRGPV